MSTITSGTVLGAGLLYDSDTTGNLVIKTGPSAATAATFHGNSATTLNGDVYLTNISTPLRPLVSGTANSSISGGTVVDFPIIPSWAKRVTVVFSGVSTNGTSVILVQLGSGSTNTSGYLGGAVSVQTTTPLTANYTTGFGLAPQQAAVAVHHGAMIINLVNSSTNAWTAISTSSRSDIAQAGSSSGSIALAGVLDRVRVTTVNGTDTFDAGTINIMWE